MLAIVRRQSPEDVFCRERLIKKTNISLEFATWISYENQVLEICTDCESKDRVLTILYRLTRAKA